MPEPKILIVDDEEAARYGMQRVLKSYAIREAASVPEARQLIAADKPDLLLLDINLPGVSGLDYLRELQTQPDAPPVVMLTAHGNERTAVEAIKAGAYDYLAKPFEVDELRLVVKNALETRSLKRENQELREALKAARGVGDLLGTSEPMRRIYDLINKVAATDVTVLIRGESGTGKELVARAIHEQSHARRKGEFIAMNCAALPSELIESELFGHEKGAFTGAAAQRKGKFELANGGTIFLDEIGDMSLNTQAKLLRVLEERKVERLGSSQTVSVDVRVVSATNRDLQQAVDAGTFRADLYYRLRVVQLDLPPLRERRADIPLLAAHFLQGYAERYQLKCAEISAEAMKRLIAYDWPGNVRELRNALERSVVLTDGTSLQASDLPTELLGERTTNAAPLVSAKTETPAIATVTAPMDEGALSIPFLDDFREARREFERAYIERCLHETGGNVTRAAERVGMHRQSLQQKLKDLGLTRRYVFGDEAPDSDDE